MDPLQVTLRRLRLRLAIQQWVGITVRTLMVTVSAACLWVVVSRLFPVLGDPMLASAGLMALGMVAATVWSLLRPPSLVRAALEADRRLGLRERLTSSLELADDEGLMVDALHADARRHLEGVNFKKHFPLSASRGLRWVYAPLIAFVLVYYAFPEFDLLGQKERAAEAKAKDAAVDVRVERIQATVRALQEEDSEAAGVASEISGAVDKVAGDLKTGAITEKQALARIGNLSDKMAKHRELLANGKPMPQVLGDMAKMGAGRELAQALKDGRMGDALKEARKLQEALRKGNLSPEEVEKMAKDLGKLAEMLGGPKSEVGKQLSEALAQAAQAAKEGDRESAAEAMESVQLALEDMESVLEQLEKMDTMLANLGEWRQDLLGPSEFCRICGTKLQACDGGESCDGTPGHTHDGVCATCATSGNYGQGFGLGGAGMGEGNRVGELPEVLAGFQPTKATGPLTRGKMLADILQKASPEEGAEASLEYISGAFVAVAQEAEQALTKEEIPAASKEYVRQYFGSLEPEKTSGTP